MEIINVTDEIIEINVTEEVVNIQAPTGAYPLPNAVNSVFGRVGNIIATEGDYTLTQLGDVTLTSPANGQVLKYNGTQWVNSTDIDTGITTLNTLTALSQTFATGSSGTDFNISSATSTHTFNLPTASATNRGLLSSADWTTFNAKQNALTNHVTGTGTTNTLPKFTGASTIGNSNITDTGSLITLGSNTQISNGALGIGTFPSVGYSLLVGKTITGATTSFAINNSGVIQSDVTGAGIYNATFAQTAAATFTLGTVTHYFANQGTFGEGSTVSTQVGFQVNANLIGATNNYGFRGAIPSGTNRWNLYMDGTANNYLAGSLGIGSTGLTGRNLQNSKNITGSVVSYAQANEGVIQSDVTTAGIYYRAQGNTAAATFTTDIQYYNASQGTFGAGSTVTNQYGYIAGSFTGATNNYGFYGLIPSGTNRWNLYMQGTAANYLAGDTAIGTTSLGTATQLTVGGTETAVSAIARGQLINTTLVASANNDTTIALDINPTFTNGAFTGVRNYWLQLVGNGAINGTNQILLLRAGSNVFSASSVETNVSSSAASLPLKFSLNSNATNVGQFFGTTGNFTLQNGGTFTDAGFRLDVNGTTRFIGTASSDTAPLGAELAAVTGTGTNWTLAGTNLNVGGYTHTTGSVDPLTTALAAVNGTYYQIAYTITGRTTGSITINYGGTSTSGITATGATGPLSTSTAVLTITPTTDFNGTVVLSIKTIGTSAPSSTFSTSASTSNIEVRASSSSNNTFIGLQTGRRNTTGTSNTFIGVIAGRENSTGTENTFIGSGAGQINITSSSNTFIGSNAGANNISVGFNTFLGNNAGLSNTLGNSNTFLGRSSGQNITTGFQNVMIGNDAGRFITGGSTINTTSFSSIFIGVSTRAAADNQGNQIVIGHNTTGLGSNTTIIGNSSTTLTALYGSVIANGTSINASAVLQADSTTKGFLPPRMTTVQKLAIGTPASGLMVFDTTLNQMSYFNGTIWINF
jgi:hypothetical protein